MSDEHTEDLRDLPKPELKDVAAERGVPVSGTKEEIAVRIEEAQAESSEKPDQVPARDMSEDPDRGPADPKGVNLETPKSAKEKPNDRQAAAESHLNEYAPGVLPGHESDSEIAHRVANQAKFPSHEPAVDQAPNMEGDKLRPQPVQVDGRNRRNDNDAIEGGWVYVFKGEHQGRSGSFLRVLQHAADGYPKQIIVKTRDAEKELLSVAYEHVRPSQRGGGR